MERVCAGPGEGTRPLRDPSRAYGADGEHDTEERDRLIAELEAEKAERGGWLRVLRLNSGGGLVKIVR
jgi:hypothetical protein